jgi:hypothetical protein
VHCFDARRAALRAAGRLSTLHFANHDVARAWRHSNAVRQFYQSDLRSDFVGGGRATRVRMIDVVTRFAGAAVAVSLVVCLRLFAHRCWKNVVLRGESAAHLGTFLYPEFKSQRDLQKGGWAFFFLYYLSVRICRVRIFAMNHCGEFKSQRDLQKGGWAFFFFYL